MTDWYGKALMIAKTDPNFSKELNFIAKLITSQN